MKRIKKIMSIFLATVLVVSMTAMSASAAEVYHISNVNYTWFPTHSTSARDTSPETMTSDKACVEGVLYSVNQPIEIKVVLQKIKYVAGLEVVIGESNASYLVKYEGGQTRNLRTNKDVTGKFFRLNFVNLEEGAKYRVRFCDPSQHNIQIAVNNVYFYNK